MLSKRQEASRTGIPIFLLVLSHSFPLSLPLRLLFSLLANFILLRTRQLSHLYSLNRLNDEQARCEMRIVYRVLL